MKKRLSIALSVLLILSTTGCSNQNNKAPLSEEHSSSIIESQVSDAKTSSENTSANLESITSSYYAARASKAFEMLNKNIFKNILNDWIKSNIGHHMKNPTWNYDTFTEYQILDHNMKAPARQKELYYCTFSADDNKYGYVVVAYQKDDASLEKISIVETAYLYDLQNNLDEIISGLLQTELDLSTAIATRVLLVDTENDRTDQVIRFVDDKGHDYMCFFNQAKEKIYF